jgi:hypothetical protein
MSYGELTQVPLELAGHLTTELAAAAVPVKAAAWPPDGVGEPAVWVELSAGRVGPPGRTVEWQVVLAVPAGRHFLLASLVDLVWRALDRWRPLADVTVDRAAIDFSTGTELVAGDSLPGARFTIPTTYRPC